MEMNDDKKMLPKRSLIFSKRMVALALALIAGGVAMVLSPWGYGKVVGVTFCAVGFWVLFTAGYYWGCENETCS